MGSHRRRPISRVLRALGRGDPVLVVAGAGCAKTTLLCDVATKLISSTTAPASVLALAFSRPAAAEMTQRVRAATGSTWRASTFHRWCSVLLRHCGQPLKVRSDFLILDPFDVADVLGDLRGEAGLDGSRVTSAALRELLSTATNTGRKLDEVAADRGYQQHVAAITKLRRIYRAYKTAHGYLDLDDCWFSPSSFSGSPLPLVSGCASTSTACWSTRARTSTAGNLGSCCG